MITQSFGVADDALSIGSQSASENAARSTQNATPDYDALKLGNQLCFPLYAAARKIVSAYTPLLKPLGITYTQYIVFMVLWEKRETTVRELGQTLLLDSGTLTPVLKKLESEGYITRSRDEGDERVVNVRISEKGMELREKAASVPTRMASCVTLDPGEAAELYRILYKILGQ